MTNTNKIPVFFSVNDRYAGGLSVTIASLIEHANNHDQYDLIVLYQDLSQENQNQLATLAKDNVTIRFVALDDKFSELFDNDQNKLRADYVTLTIYYRLFIADLFPEFDKGIYLDADLLILDDIAKLYSIDLEGCIVGAINDRFLATDPIMQKYADQAVGIEHNLYVNSGVLLMDLKQFRNTKFTKRFLAILTKYHFTLIAPDQDYLNALAKNNLYQLPVSWNVQTAMLHETYKPVHLVHYNLFEKPWNYEHVPFKELFWEAAKKSPYYAELRDSQKAETAEAIQRDQKKAELLINTAKDLTNNKVSLRTVLADSGGLDE